jgi:hypothetical protein
MPGDGIDQPLVLTANGHRSDAEEILDLGHRDASLGQSTQPADDATSSKFDDEKTMRLAEWVYLNVEEVWSAFNLLAEATARGFEARPVDDADEQAVADWNRAVAIEDKVRMWIKNALVYGRCVMEAGEDFLKVRNPRSMELEQDEDGELVEVTQVLDDGEHPVPVDRVHVFTLHRLFSDDVRGISAVQPVLQTVDDMVGASRVNRAIQERYRAPIRIIEMPSDATDQDRKSLQSQLEETPPDMDLVLPPGAKVTVVGHGDDQVDVDELMSHQFVDRIFIGLDIPKVALGLPDGSNRSTSRTQRRLLLEQSASQLVSVVPGHSRLNPHPSTARPPPGHG